LKVKPENRPSCVQILKSDRMLAHMERLGIDTAPVFKTPAPLEGLEVGVEGYQTEDESQTINLLTTIKLPKNLNMLSTRLPKANYGEEGYSSSTTTHGNYQSGLSTNTNKNTNKSGKENHKGFESDSG